MTWQSVFYEVAVPLGNQWNNRIMYIFNRTRKAIRLLDQVVRPSWISTHTLSIMPSTFHLTSLCPSFNQHYNYSFFLIVSVLCIVDGKESIHANTKHGINHFSSLFLFFFLLFWSFGFYSPQPFFFFLSHLFSSHCLLSVSLDWILTQLKIEKKHQIIIIIIIMPCRSYTTDVKLF